MKTNPMHKTLAVVLSVLMLFSIMPIGAMATTIADWQVDGDYVILSGQSLIDATVTSSISSTKIVYDAGRTYVKYTASTGTTPSVELKQTKSGINLAEYDYYVFSYYQSQSADKLDVTFKADFDASAFGERGSDWLWTFYEQWSANGHPKASVGAWSTKTMERSEFYGCGANNNIENPEDFIPVFALNNQSIKFKPWTSTALEGSYFALEYFACFKTKEEAAAFVEMQSAAQIPVTSISVEQGGNAVSEITTPIGNTVDVDIVAIPTYAANAVSVSVDGSSVSYADGVFTAIKSGTSTVTLTANTDIEGTDTLTQSFTVSVVAPTHIVIPASELAANTTLNNLSGTTSVVDDDTLGKRLLKTEITTSTAGGDNAYINYDISSYGVLAREYPYFKIGYIAKTTNSTYADLNIGVTGYRPAGTGTATSARLWGYKPKTAQETFSTFDVSYSSFTSGDKSWGNTSADFSEWINYGHDWTYIDETGIYSYLRPKFWPSSSTSNAVGDYVAIEYIAFFNSETAMNDFVYTIELDGFSVPETLSIPQNSTKKIEATVEPEGAYVKLVYESEDETVATVSETGNVLGLNQGTTTITVSTADGAYSDTCEVTVTEPIDSNYIVLTAQDLLSNTSVGGMTAKTTLVDNDDLAMRVLRTEITSGGNSGDSTGITYSVNNANILAKKYPYIQIGYIASIANQASIDFNLGVNKYYPDGGESYNYARLWGYRPSYENTGTFKKLSFNASQVFTGGYPIGTTYSWNNIGNDGTYNQLLLKLWGGNGGKTTTTGDYFEVQYIAFFTDEDTMNNYVYDTELRNITVIETLSFEKGTISKLPVTLEPSSAYAKLVYTSDDETVAKVLPDGNVIGMTAGTANITVTTSDGKYSGTCVVTITAPEKDYSQYITDRGNLDNLVYKLKNDEEITVVYLGGSVTAGAGASSGDKTSWRGLTGEWLANMFPNANIIRKNSAMGGSGSMLGAFRTDVDVLAYDPDLVFVEFAVNDSYSGHYADGTVQFYYESILRQIREKSPDTEIISIFTADQGHLNNTSKHAVAALQDEVAAHYGVSSIDVGLALCNHIVAEGAAWNDYVTDSVHPADAGYKIYAAAIEQYLFSELFEYETEPTAIVNHTVPETYIDSRNETFVPKYVTVSEDIFDSITGWTYNSGKAYSHLDTAGYIYPSEDENSFTYTFIGTGIAFYMEYNGGKYYVDYSIDGGNTTSLKVTNTNHPFNSMYKTGSLEYGPHTITFSFKGTEGTGGTNQNVKLTRLLVSQIASDSDVVAGDVNGNGTVEASDSVILARYLANWSAYEDNVNLANSDVDGVEGVTAGDSVVLARHLANWSGYDTLPLTHAQ